MSSSLGIYASQISGHLYPTVSGGVLTSDATYYYRTFTSTGTLSITGSSLVADVLCLAGGGSGGTITVGLWSGAGGAGGLLYSPSQTLSASSYSAVIGAGGGVGSSGSNTTFGSLFTAIGGGAGAYSTFNAAIAGTINTGGGGGGGFYNGGAANAAAGGSGFVIVRYTRSQVGG